MHFEGPTCTNNHLNTDIFKLPSMTQWELKPFKFADKTSSYSSKPAFMEWYKYQLHVHLG